MIRKIILDNFKSFAHVEFDLSKEKSAKNMGIIYGENGSGKTNIIEAVDLLKESVTALTTYIKVFSNIAELEKNPDIKDIKFFNAVLKSQFNNLMFKDFLKEVKTIGSDENMKMEFEICYEDKIFNYIMEFSNEAIIRECLKYPIKKSMATVFEVTKSGKDDIIIKANDMLFKDKEYKKEIKRIANQYWGNYTLIAILFNESISKNKSFLGKAVDIGIIDFIDSIYNITVIVNDKNSVRGMVAVSTLSSMLKGGDIITNKSEFEEYYKPVIEGCNVLFKELYSDVNRIYYTTEQTEEDEVKVNLYFEKNIGGKLRAVPFNWESNGTKRIVYFFPAILMAIKGESVWIDEMDLGIHDIIIRNILKAISGKIKGQLIITTHNTTLLEFVSDGSIPKESIYILDSDYKSEKRINCINEYSIKSTNNVRNMYLRGEFGGISFSDYIDVDYIIEVANAAGEGSEEEDKNPL